MTSELRPKGQEGGSLDKLECGTEDVKGKRKDQNLEADVSFTSEELNQACKQRVL